MNTDHGSLFELLEPPSGGVEKLRARLAEAHLGPVGASPLWAFSVLAVVALVALLYYLPDAPEPSPLAGPSILEAPEFDRLLGRELLAVPISVQLNQQPVAAEEIESTDPKVRIYELP
jgi:hypothetical protein